ncbi:hypothetical protein BDN71DRAFT_1447448 [Pleurotus eryngii]|uniref:Uncharacterized protein n=1 Tax=Pleurotus eryngii TaxID=5323 RepID=A0A9P6A0B0_PLEER|nr:hypothetical protein BDN71DRAFT_1447448 [Pleurotus eryngii]
MAKKKTVSSISKPSQASNNTPQVPSALDEQPKKSTARELLEKAFNRLPAFRKLATRLGISDEEEDIVKDIETYIVAQKDEADKPIGFSSANISMLEELNIRPARFDFDAEKLKEVAKGRAVSERFTLDLSFMRHGGLSAKEQLASIATVNYLFESMYNAPGIDLSRLCAKFSPELKFPAGTQANSNTGAAYTFHGAADYVLFLVNNSVNLDDRDISDLKAALSLCAKRLVVVEVKSFETVFKPQHIAEAVAQAVTASYHSKWNQRFIMTDSTQWKFCLYRWEERTYYLSETLTVAKHGEEAILTVLDEWVWNADNSDSPLDLWPFKPVEEIPDVTT